MEVDQQRMSRRQWIALGVILALALALRLVSLDSMEFGRDAAFNLMKARELARLRNFPLTSATSSTGIPEPPIFMYLLALPIAISDHPVFVTGAIASLNALAVLPLFFLTKRHISSKAAPIAAALYAVNPWQILYSRKIWTQDLLPIFALLSLLLLFEAVFAERKGLLAPALGLLAVTVQLHLSAAFLMPFVVVFLLRQRDRVRRRELAAGGLLATLLFMPYLVFLAKNTGVFLEALGEIRGSAFIPRATGVLYPLQLVTTDGLDHVTLLFRSHDRFARGMVDLTALSLLSRGLLMGGLGYSLLQDKPATRTLGGYTLLALVYVIASNNQIFPHYYNALLPVLFILTALPLSALLANGHRTLASVACFAYAAIFVGQLYFSGSLLAFLSHEDCIFGEYGPPYRQQVIAISEVVEEWEGGQALELTDLHEQVSSCPDWSILATEYIYEQLMQDRDG